MKSSQIHEGLPQKEIRDFLGIAMIKSYEAEFDNKKKIVQHFDDDNTLDWVIEDAREQIKYLEKYIENIQDKKAIIILMTKMGWDEHDVSDHVRNDTGYRLSMNFIGTPEEYDVFFNEHFGL